MLGWIRAIAALVCTEETTVAARDSRRHLEFENRGSHVFLSQIQSRFQHWCRHCYTILPQKPHHMYAAKRNPQTWTLIRREFSGLPLRNHWCSRNTRRAGFQQPRGAKMTTTWPSISKGFCSDMTVSTFASARVQIRRPRIWGKMLRGLDCHCTITVILRPSGPGSMVLLLVPQSGQSWDLRCGCAPYIIST